MVEVKVWLAHGVNFSFFYVGARVFILFFEGYSGLVSELSQINLAYTYVHTCIYIYTYVLDIEYLGFILCVCIYICIYI